MAVPICFSSRLKAFVGRLSYYAMASHVLHRIPDLSHQSLQYSISISVQDDERLKWLMIWSLGGERPVADARNVQEGTPRFVIRLTHPLCSFLSSPQCDRIWAVEDNRCSFCDKNKIPCVRPTRRNAATAEVSSRSPAAIGHVGAAPEPANNNQHGFGGSQQLPVHDDAIIAGHSVPNLSVQYDADS
jgi:hypothetical protein